MQPISGQTQKLDHRHPFPSLAYRIDRAYAAGIVGLVVVDSVKDDQSFICILVADA